MTLRKFWKSFSTPLESRKWPLSEMYLMGCISFHGRLLQLKGKTEKYQTLLNLFATGLIQLIFVAMTTVFISHQHYLANFLTALVVNLIWAFQVKRMVEGTATERLAYALGAATGSVTGSLIGGALL